LSEAQVQALLHSPPIDLSKVNFRSFKSAHVVTTQGAIIAPGVENLQFTGKNISNEYHFPWTKECKLSRFHRYKSSSCFIVGFVARLAKEKAVGLFLLAVRDALYIRPMIRVVIVGDGILRLEIESLVVKLGIRWAVRFVGWQPRQFLPVIYADIDVLVNTGDYV